MLQKQLENAPSIKDLQITEKLESLKEFNNNNDDNNNNNDDDDNGNAPFVPPSWLLSPPFPPPAYSLSIDSDESNNEGENPVQNFLLGGPRKDRPQRERTAVAVGEKTATAAPKKVKFSENFSKVFPNADKFLEKKPKKWQY